METGDVSPLRYMDEVNYELARLIGRPRTVLDVGCGRGTNGRIAKAKGARVVGIESDAESARAARERLDEVIVADVETDAAIPALAGRAFEIMLFGDLLEHTVRPAQVLARFLPFLEEDGRVIVSVPNVAAWPVRLKLLAGHFDYETSGILDETHLRFFTRESAVRLVQEAGLDVLHVAQNPMLVRAGLGVVRRALLPRGTGGDPSELSSHPLYKAYLDRVRPLEGRIADLAPNALSFQTVIVARRPRVRRSMSLTVGMISRNEAKAVGPVIDDIRRHAPSAELLLVDSSEDDTAQIAESKGARVVRQFPPEGFGPAMLRLLTETKTDVVVTMDCDGTYPADRILELHRRIEAGADLVNATRTQHRPEAMPLENYLGNRVFAAAAHLLHGVPTRDVHSGMRAYRTSLLRAMDLDPEGAALPVDLIVVPARLGYTLEEVEIPYFERLGTSTLQRFSSTLWTFRRLFRGHVGHRMNRAQWRSG